MTLEGMVFLAGYYWPYLLVAVVIGLVTGWRSFNPPTA